MKKIEIKTREDWRNWLTENHEKVTEIWLVYYKKHTGIESIEYKDSRDEALCFGWIDSLIKKIDDDKYARKFTPRKENSKWSVVNKKQVKELIKTGLMTEHGMKLVEAAKQNGNWDNPVQPPDVDYSISTDFAEALKNNTPAKAFFDELKERHQKEYLVWINMAKRPETKQKRIDESIKLLREKQKLGLK